MVVIWSLHSCSWIEGLLKLYAFSFDITLLVLLSGVLTAWHHLFQQWTPLHKATIENRVEDVRVLLDGGADIGARDWAVRVFLVCQM